MIINKITNKIRIKKWIREGAKIGEKFQLERSSYIDSSFPWLIEIGNDVTIAPEVMILSHDGSTKKVIGYSKIGKVKIGNNVFIGSKTIILPNTTIGDNTIVGAGSIVVGDIPPNVVISGSPAKIIMKLDEFKNKHERNLKNGKMFDESFTRKGKITREKKVMMKKELDNEKNNYII